MIFSTTIAPTEPGQRVRFLAWGGQVREYMTGMTGSVVRFTRAGNPVVRFDQPSAHNPTIVEVTDTYGCAQRVDDNGDLIRRQEV
jgi:hypothetical protein